MRAAPLNGEIKSGTPQVAASVNGWSTDAMLPARVRLLRASSKVARGHVIPDRMRLWAFRSCILLRRARYFKQYNLPQLDIYLARESLSYLLKPIDFNVNLYTFPVVFLAHIASSWPRSPISLIASPNASEPVQLSLAVV